MEKNIKTNHVSFHRHRKVLQRRPQSIATPILIIFGAARPIDFIKLFPKLQASIFIVCELCLAQISP